MRYSSSIVVWELKRKGYVKQYEGISRGKALGLAKEIRRRGFNAQVLIFEPGSREGFIWQVWHTERVN